MRDTQPELHTREQDAPAVGQRGQVPDAVARQGGVAAGAGVRGPPDALTRDSSWAAGPTIDEAAVVEPCRAPEGGGHRIRHGAHPALAGPHLHEAVVV